MGSESKWQGYNLLIIGEVIETEAGLPAQFLVQKILRLVYRSSSLDSSNILPPLHDNQIHRRRKHQSSVCSSTSDGSLYWCLLQLAKLSASPPLPRRVSSARARRIKQWNHSAWTRNPPDVTADGEKGEWMGFFLSYV
ncbi:hypothetical protein KEM48_011919 [Puccinia striiformis f. sp. tritici PST-130]|nr:hypothetical protein KEM48_011919 [Puccinia striiformis f. sp. tritici PST-130]